MGAVVKNLPANSGDAGDMGLNDASVANPKRAPGPKFKSAGGLKSL